jgi:hypothetical protein
MLQFFTLVLQLILSKILDWKQKKGVPILMGVMVLFFRSSKLMRSQIVLKFVPQGGKNGSMVLCFYLSKDSHSVGGVQNFFYLNLTIFWKLSQNKTEAPSPFADGRLFSTFFHKNMIFPSSHWRVVLFSLNFENWFYDQGVKTLFIFCRKIHFTHFPHRYSKKRKKKMSRNFW